MCEKSQLNLSDVSYTTLEASWILKLCLDNNWTTCVQSIDAKFSFSVEEVLLHLAARSP